MAPASRCNASAQLCRCCFSIPSFLCNHLCVHHHRLQGDPSMNNAEAGPSRAPETSFAIPSALRRPYAAYYGRGLLPRPCSGRPIVAHSMLDGWFGRSSRAGSTEEPLASSSSSSLSSENNADKGDVQLQSRFRMSPEMGDWKEHEETEDEAKARVRVEGWADELFRNSKYS